MKKETFSENVSAEGIQPNVYSFRLQYFVSNVFYI